MNHYSIPGINGNRANDVDVTTYIMAVVDYIRIIIGPDTLQLHTYWFVVHFLSDMEHERGIIEDKIWEQADQYNKIWAHLFLKNRKVFLWNY